MRVLPPLVIAVALGACSATEDGGNASSDAPPPRVDVVVASARTIAPEVLSFGTITYFRKTDVTANTPGHVEGMIKREGAAVASGEVLAMIRNPQYEISRRQALAAVRSAQAAVSLAEARLWEGRLAVEARYIGIAKAELELSERAREGSDARVELAAKRELESVGGVSREVIDQLESRVADASARHRAAAHDLELRRIGMRDRDLLALGLPPPQDEADRLRLVTLANTQSLRAEVDVARAQLSAAEAELASIEQLAADAAVVSPLEGIIGATHLQSGERAAAGAKVATVVDVSKVLGVFPVNEDEVHLLVESLPVEVTVDAVGGDPLAGSVFGISPVGDPQSGDFLVRVLLDNADARLRPGMFARARAATGVTRHVVEIPATTLLDRDGRSATVMVVSRQRVHATALLLGSSSDAVAAGGTRLEVARGLEAGAQLVDRPSPLLRDGMRVLIRGG